MHLIKRRLSTRNMTKSFLLLFSQKHQLVCHSLATFAEYLHHACSPDFISVAILYIKTLLDFLYAKKYMALHSIYIFARIVKKIFVNKSQSAHLCIKQVLRKMGEREEVEGKEQVR